MGKLVIATQAARNGQLMITHSPEEANEPQKQEKVQCSSRSLLRTLVPACTAQNQTRLTERCHAFSTSSSMFSVRVQHPAPDFKGPAVVNIQLSDFKGKYLVLFFYPLDFTFVCPTEIIAFSDSIDKFKALNTEVIGVSTDSHFSHLAWINTPRKQGGLGSLKYPLLSDFNKTISQDYGVLVEDQGLSLRGLFLIDPSGIVRQITINDLPVGCSVDEVLRLIQAFQFVEKHGEVAMLGEDFPPNDTTYNSGAMPTVEELSHSHGDGSHGHLVDGINKYTMPYW